VVPIFISRIGALELVRDEHEVALTQRRIGSEFIVVAAQIAEVEIPYGSDFASSDLRHFDLLSASTLLRSLTPDPPLRVDSDQDVVFRALSNQSKAARKALRALYKWAGASWRLQITQNLRIH
jgi:hypothetical protein